jgi:D-sedoheptulose 7-phosphate isomerase
MRPMSDYLRDCISRYPQLSSCEKDMERAHGAIAASFRNGGKLLTCGNGGSASDAGHIMGELMKSFRAKRRVDENVRKVLGDVADGLQGALPTISLPDFISINTAYANDNDPYYCFAQLVYGLGNVGDSLLCISTSGNAKNINIAASVAKAKGISVIGLTGVNGGDLAPRCDICIKAPETVTHKIQELHLPIYHTLCLMLEQTFFGE